MTRNNVMWDKNMGTVANSKIYIFNLLDQTIHVKEKTRYVDLIHPNSCYCIYEDKIYHGTITEITFNGSGVVCMFLFLIPDLNILYSVDCVFSNKEKANVFLNEHNL